MNDIVIAQVLFHEGDIHRTAFKIDLKDISSSVKKSRKVHTFAIGGREITPWIREDQDLEGSYRRADTACRWYLAGAGDPAGREAAAKKLAAVEE